MRILLSSIGSRGDVQPLVAMALQLKALDHEPRLCVPPDFREWIESLGIPVTPIGPEVRRFAAARPMGTKDQVPLTPEQRRQMAEATVDTQFLTIGAAAEGCSLIVAATALQIAARSIAERLGIPYVFVAYSPIVLPSAHHAPPPLPGQTPDPNHDNRDLWARDAARFHDLFGARLNAQRSRLGLPPVNDVRSHMFTGAPWLAADPTLGPWPESGVGGVFQPGAWIWQDDRPLSTELEAFLGRGDPPIYFGFGSTRPPQDGGRTLLAVSRALGRRAVVSRGWFDLSWIEDEPDCLSIGEVNVLALFPRVAAAVHHGGAGTTTAAALAGAPQVVIPDRYDQHYWAQQVHNLGIGVHHAPGIPSVDSLRNALEQALGTETAAQARLIQSRVRRDGTAIGAKRLVDLARDAASESSRA